MGYKKTAWIFSVLFLLVFFPSACSAGIPQSFSEEGVPGILQEADQEIEPDQNKDPAGQEETREEEFCIAPMDATLVEILSPDYISNNILLVGKDGSLIHRITDDRYNNYDPGFSPDKTKIAYFSNAQGVFDIYVLDLAAGELQNITQNDFQDYSPSFCPRTGHIAYVSDKAGLNEIYLVHDDGTAKRKLHDIGFDQYEPIWSMDGQRIFYLSDEDGVLDIYAVSIDGTGRQKLTSSAYFAQNLSLSPDGLKIVYSAYEIVSTVTEIFVLDLSDGENQVLTDTLCYNTMPLWALGGSTIVFNSVMEGYFAIYRMDSDGKNLEKVIGDQEDNHLLSISDDGENIFYQVFDGDEKTSLYMHDLIKKQTVKIAIP